MACFQLFMEFGYFRLHFAFTLSSASKAVSSEGPDKSFQIVGKRFAILVGYIFQGITYLMDDASLAFCLRISRSYGSSMLLYLLSSSPFTMRQTGTASLNLAVIFPVFIMFSTFRILIFCTGYLPCEWHLTHV